MTDNDGPAKVADQIVSNLGEWWGVANVPAEYAMNLSWSDVTARIYESCVFVAGGQILPKGDDGNLHDSVTSFRPESSGLGIQNGKSAIIYIDSSSASWHLSTSFHQ